SQIAPTHHLGCNDEGLRRTQARGQREQFQSTGKASARIRPTLQIEGHDGAELLHLSLCQLVLRVRGQPWIVYAGNRRMGCKMLGYPHRALTLCLVANKVGLESAQDEERRMRVECSSQDSEVGTQSADEIAATDDRASHHISRA